MPYDIEMPDGSVFSDIPDNINPAEAKKKILTKFPEYADRSLGGTAKDVGVAALKSAVGLPQAISGVGDIVGAPFGLSPTRGFENIGVDFAGTQKLLDDAYSIEQQAAQARVQEGEGFLGRAKTLAQNPSVLAQEVGESLGSMVGGAGVARGLMTAAPKLVPMAAGALGEGIVGAGSAAADTQEATGQPLEGRQAWANVGSGAGTALFGFVGGKISQRLGINDIDTVLASGEFQQASKGFARRLAEGGISEGVFEELPQSMQEQMWQNYATGKPVMEGVPEAGAHGMMAGAMMGGVAGVPGGGQSAQNTKRIPDTKHPITEAPPPPPPGATEPITFTDTDAELAELTPLIAEIDKAFGTGAQPETPPTEPPAGPVNMNEATGEEQADYNAYLDATALPREDDSPAGTPSPVVNQTLEGLDDPSLKPDMFATPEVRNNPDNFGDPNTWVPRAERRVVRAAGTGAATAAVGTHFGQMTEDQFDTTQGPVVLQVGEDSDQRPGWYLKSLVDEVFDLAQEFNPRGVYVILPEDAGIQGTDSAQGYSFKHNGIHYIVPRHLTNANEQGSHISKEGMTGAYNTNARLQAGSTLWHEFGHSLLEDFLTAGAVNEGLLRLGLENGQITEDMLAGLAPEVQALIRRWAALRGQMLAGDMSGHEAAARFMSPVKLANQTLMQSLLSGTDKKAGNSNRITVPKKPFDSTRVARALRRNEVDNFWEFAAEQMAKYMLEEGRLEGRKLTQALFPEEFGSQGFETALKKFFEPMMKVLQRLFNSMKARGFVRAEAEFTDWLDRLAKRNPEVKPEKQKRKRKAKAKVPKEGVQTAEQLEASIDWGSKGTQDTLKAALASAIRAGDVELGSEQHKEFQQMLKNGQYAMFVDMLEPLLAKKIKFDTIGEKAKLSPMQRLLLRDAKKMEQAGANPAGIQLATGWKKWPDGFWRFEISSHQARLLRLPKDVNEVLPLTDVLDHHELYKRYPQLRKIKVGYNENLGSGNAEFYENTGWILTGYNANDPAQVARALPLILHEVQHAIQAIEGFARGGNRGMFIRPNAKELIDDARTKLYTFAHSPRGRVAFAMLTQDLMRLAGAVQNDGSILHIGEDAVAVRNRLLQNFAKGIDTVTIKMTDGEYSELPFAVLPEIIQDSNTIAAEAKRELLANFRVKAALTEMVNEKAQAGQKYYRLLGEIEAYATQERAGWTPAMRKRTPIAIRDDFIISYALAATKTWASGTTVADSKGDPLTVVSSKLMSFAVDGVRVQAYSASQLDANWLSSITEQRVEGTPLYPFVVRMMTPLVYDAAGRNLTPGMLQGLVRQARTAGNDGITIKNALGYQGPVFVNLAADNSRRVDKAPPGSQIRFDRTSPEGQQMATMWETVKDKISLPRVKEALAKMWQMQFWALQMQQLAHVHAAWMPLRMWEETRLKFYRKAAQMHSRADATVRQLQQLGKEQMAQLYKLTLEEYRKMEHWTELVQVDAWHWEHRPTAVLLEKMRAVGIDVDSPSGAQMLQLYLDAKNALQFQQDEMERVLAVLTKHKYKRNPERLMRALSELRMQFKVLRSTPFWPQQVFGGKVIRVYETDDQGRKMLVFESGSDSNTELAEIEATARRKFPNGLLVRENRGTEDAIMMRLPVEFVDEVATAMGLDPTVAEDAEKISEIRDLMQSLYAKTPVDTYGAGKAVVQGGSTDFLRNFADFSLRNSNFIAKMEFRKYFDVAASAMQAEIDAMGWSTERDARVAAKKLMQDSVSYMMDPNEEMQQIRGFMAVTYLWANMKTALLNFWGLMHTWLYLNRELGYVAGAGAFAKGMAGSGKTLAYEGADLAMNLMKGSAREAYTSITDPNWEIVDGQPTELRQALETAKRENVLDQSYAYYLAGQALRGDMMRAATRTPGGKAWKAVVDTGMAPFRVTELAIRRGTFIAIYSALQQRRPELNPEARYEETVRMVSLLQGDYTKGNKPRIMRGQLMSLITLFMTYVHNAAWGAYGGIEMGLKRQEALEGRASPGWYRSYTVQIMVLYLVAAGVEGMPFAENALDVLDWVYKKWISSNGRTARQDLDAFLLEQLEDPVKVMQATRGLTFNIGGIDMSGSIGLGRPVPGTDKIFGGANTPTEYIGSVAQGVGGIAGGYVSWLISTGMAMERTKAGVPLMQVLQDQTARLPGGIGNMTKAAQWAEIDARGPAGGLIARDPETGKSRELTQTEIALKAAGFQPSAVSLGQQAKAARNDVVVYWTERKKGLLKELFHAQTVIKDREATADVKRAIGVYNSKVPFPEMKITRDTVKRSMDNRKRGMENEQSLKPLHKTMQRVVEERLEPYGIED